MGEDLTFDYYAPNSYYHCPNSRVVRDCDGDIMTTCNSVNECPYKKIVRDCDGDWIELCTKY